MKFRLEWIDACVDILWGTTRSAILHRSTPRVGPPNRGFVGVITITDRDNRSFSSCDPLSAHRPR